MRIGRFGIMATTVVMVLGACADERGGAGGGAANGGGGTSGNNGNITGPVPMFPGTGTSSGAGPLPGGEICDVVPGSTLRTVDDHTRCFYGMDDRTNPAATIEQVLECAEGSTVLHLRLTFAPWFNDNTYGAGSIGWPERGGRMGMTRAGHTFRDLVGSDHAELVLMDGDGEVAMQFKLDYISEDASAPSGYSALGVSGGEGEVSIGDAAHIIDATTSLDVNLNERGYGSYIVDSPATDANYTANSDTPEWDYRIVFDVWVDLEAFGDAGFSGAFIEYVHASPAKAEDDTIETTPDECPPTWDPCLDDKPDTYCNEPPAEDPCRDDKPDTYCSDGSEPNEPEPPYCVRYPTDPACIAPE